jgi:hypothetical protein
VSVTRTEEAFCLKPQGVSIHFCESGENSFLRPASAKAFFEMQASVLWPKRGGNRFALGASTVTLFDHLVLQGRT